MARTLVDRALEKADKAEREGKPDEVKHWLEIAERAERVYDKLDQANQGGGKSA